MMRCMNFLRRLLHRTAPQPDLPRSFGYNQTWLTVASVETVAVVRTLNVTHARPCTWQEGIHLALPRQLFVSPPVQTWIFVVGQSLPRPDSHSHSRHIVPMLNRLSAEFGVAHYF